MGEREEGFCVRNGLRHARRSASAIAAGETFAHAWFTEVEGQAIRESDAAELGERRWAVQGGSDTAAFVEIEWTRANAVLSVYVNCSPCASDVTEAARRWAEAMDERVPTLAE